MPKRKCNAIDRVVEQNIRTLRLERGWSQIVLGAKLGLTFQMIQKCELGKSRISARRLFEISRMMDVPVEMFFQTEQ